MKKATGAIHEAINHLGRVDGVVDKKVLSGLKGYEPESEQNNLRCREPSV
jgi:hypothetical protein